MMNNFEDTVLKDTLENLIICCEVNTITELPIKEITDRSLEICNEAINKTSTQSTINILNVIKEMGKTNKILPSAYFYLGEYEKRYARNI